MTEASFPGPALAPPAERRRRLLCTTAYYAAFVGLGLTNAALGPTLPGLAAHTHARLSEISFLFTAKAFGYLVGSSQGGRVYDRLPGSVLMAGCVLLLALTLAVTPMVPLLWLLTIVLFLWGVGEGSVEVGGTAMLLWLYGARVGPLMNGIHLVAGIGAIAAPLIIARALQATGDVTWGFWALALLLLPVVFGLARLPSPTPQRAAEPGAAGAVRPALVLLFAVFLFLYVGCEIGFGGWIYTYAVESGLMAATAAAVLTSSLWASLTVGRLIGIPATARFSAQLILIVDLLVCVASLGSMLLWPASTVALRLGTLGMGLGMATIWPTTMSLAGRHMTMTGKVTGWFFIGPSLGGMLLPWVIGQRFAADGPLSVIIINTVDIALATLVFGLLTLYIARTAHPRHAPGHVSA